MRFVRASLISLAILSCGPAFAQQSSPSFPFEGEVKSSSVNIRIDATIGSEAICTVSRGEPLSVLGESYDWYKVRLPRGAPSYVKKTLVAPLDNRTVKVLKDNVNIRLRPTEQSPILGRVQSGEVLSVRGNAREWFEIEPVHNSYGWINKKFVLTFRTGMQPPQDVSTNVSAKKPSAPVPGVPVQVSTNGEITAEGIVEPYGKVINRIASHKLVIRDKEEKVFLLKASRGDLDAVTYRKVKVSGKLITPSPAQQFPVIEVATMELLD